MQVNILCVLISNRKIKFSLTPRGLAASIKKPFELRYNPYTQSVDALTTSGKIMDLAKELRGDMFLISNAVIFSANNEFNTIFL